MITMGKGRLEAFSDGVLAIILTIMVLELRAPHEVQFPALFSVLPVFFSYVLSFLYIGIYWNNHHHLVQTAHHVNGGILWANLHLLFWLSLVPFATDWMGENPAAPAPAALYGMVLFMAAIAYTLLQQAILRNEGRNSLLSRAVGGDGKGKISIALYILGIACCYFKPWLGQFLYLAVAFIWILPDRRIEKTLIETPSSDRKSDE